jgi:thiol-disulfide isomerase/thioredoxin
MSIPARSAAGILLIGSVGWFVFLPVDAAAPPVENGVELKAAKYADLVKAVRAQRGKVIVIDVWGDFCVPCKKEFHNLIEMHERYADKGLVCMSVALDPPEGRDRALRFLMRKKATFANYWLDEKPELWTDRWGIKGPPAVFVFDRQGKRAGKFDSEEGHKPWSYEDVEKLVQKLLAPSR